MIFYELQHRLNSGSRNVSFPLPQSASGVIIGKSGKKLQNMREKYGCKILLRRIEAVSDERVLTITADNAATVIEVNVLYIFRCNSV